MEMVLLYLYNISRKNICNITEKSRATPFHSFKTMYHITALPEPPNKNKQNMESKIKQRNENEFSNVSLI